MPKTVTFTFTLDDYLEQNAALRAFKADHAYRCLWEIAQEIFRPARKHGYSDPKLNEALSNQDLDHEEIIGLLEEKFFDILKSNDVSLEDYQ